MKDQPTVSDKKVYLNLAAWEERSVANGPGERFVLWVQGCPFRCPGCINEDFLRFTERHRMDVETVAAMIQRVPGIEGVTYSGGEPMAQAEGLLHLSQVLKEKGLTIVSYSGHTLEELQGMNNPWVDRFLSCLDILIDGRYEEAARANLMWRGSRNQKVHFLTDAYRHLSMKIYEERSDVEMIMKSEGFVSTGVLNRNFLKRLEEVLDEGPR